MFAAHEGARAVPRDHYYSNGGPHSSDISFNFQTLLRRGDGAWCIWLSLYKYAQCEYVMLSLALFGVALGGHGQGAPQELATLQAGRNGTSEKDCCIGRFLWFDDLGVASLLLVVYTVRIYCTYTHVQVIQLFAIIIIDSLDMRNLSYFFFVLMHGNAVQNHLYLFYPCYLKMKGIYSTFARVRTLRT